MKFSATKCACIVAVVIGLAANSASAAWVTFYTHTQDPAVGGCRDCGGPSPFSIRGLALAKNGTGDVYYGHIHWAMDYLELLPLSLNVVRLDATGALLGYRVVCGTCTYNPTAQPKTLATDDRGYVYTAFKDGWVHVYSADLSVEVTSFSANPTPIEGVDVRRSGSTYYLYTSSRDDGVVKKWDVTTIASPSFVTSRDLPGTDTRGLAADGDGNVFVADKGGTVFKIAADFLSHTSTSVASAMDIAVDECFAYVSQQAGASSAITTLLLEDLSPVGVLTDPIYGTSYAGLAGIDTDGIGKIWVADEDAVTSTVSNPDEHVDRIYTIDGAAPACPATPVQRHTWGQIKSHYR